MLADGLSRRATSGGCSLACVYDEKNHAIYVVYHIYLYMAYIHAAVTYFYENMFRLKIFQKLVIFREVLVY